MTDVPMAATKPEKKRADPFAAGQAYTIIAAVLVIFGLISLVSGMGSLSNATSGMGSVAAACFLGILARIAQAAGHHKSHLALARDERTRHP